MKILISSDQHGRFDSFQFSKDPDIEGVKAIFLCGDETDSGIENSFVFQKYINWLREISKIAPVYYIFGNHSLGMKSELVKVLNVYFIENTSVTINSDNESFSVYGVNMSPCYNSPELQYYWANMTCREEVEEAAYSFEKVDIVVSHCPPLGVLDRARNGLVLGSKYLKEYIDKYNPRFVFCGHIHESRGYLKVNNTHVFNIACAYKIIETENYK